MESTEIIFEMTGACKGGYDARALLGDTIFKQGENWNDLKAMVRDGCFAISTTRCHGPS